MPTAWSAGGGGCSSLHESSIRFTGGKRGPEIGQRSMLFTEPVLLFIQLTPGGSPEKHGGDQTLKPPHERVYALNLVEPPRHLWPSVLITAPTVIACHTEHFHLTAVVFRLGLGFREWRYSSTLSNGQ